MGCARTAPVRALLAWCLLALAAPRGALSKCWVGVNYSLNTLSKTEKIGADPSMAILLKENPSSIKLYQPEPAVFKHLAGKDIEVVVGVPIDQTHSLARSPNAARAWLEKHIYPYLKDVKIVNLAVANEKLQHDTGNIVNDIVPAMWSLYYALRSRGLEKTIKVTTPQHPGFLRTPVPPSRAEAVEAFKPHWAKLLDFITKTDSFLYVTAYPFFGFKDDKSRNRDFALFKGWSGYYDKGLYYQNGLDSTLDAFLWAAEKLGYKDIDIAVAETGWPTAGDRDANNRNAEEYYHGLMNKICSAQGTPKRPQRLIKTWLFEAFDEDWKRVVAPYEAHFGYRTWDGKGKFSLSFDQPGGSSLPLLPEQKWCVVRNGADGDSVEGSVDWACADGGVDCEAYNIKSCNEGTRSRANAVYNQFFQNHEQHASACDFSGTGRITNQNPFNPKHPRCVLPGRPTAAASA